MARSRVPTVGLLVAAFGLAVLLIVWSQGPVDGAVIAVMVGAVAAVTAVGTFSARRHGRIGPISGALVAAVAGIVLAISGLFLAIGETGTLPAAVVILTGLTSVGCAAAEMDMIRAATAITATQSLLYAAALGFGGLFVASLVAVTPRTMDAAGVITLPHLTTFALEQLGMGLGLAAAAVAFVVLSGRGLAYFDISQPNRRDLVWTVGGTALVVVAAIGIGLLYWSLGIEAAEHDLARRGAQEGAELLLIAIPLTVIATAVGEELLYRNGIQKYLTEHFQPAVAILATSIIFAVVHIPALIAPGIAALLATLAIIVALSIILGVAYERTQNVVVPILIHGIYNVFVFGIWYLELVA